MKPIWYSSDELNAPTLNNAAGSVISVLDAVLVNGFGLKSVSSITVASGVATCVCTGHQFTGGVGRRVQIAGASPAALNDNHNITVVDSNTFTFPTTAANGVATGTITAKRPSLGWSKPHTGTNVAMYARPDVQSTAMLLRISDTNATTSYARMFGVESATGIDTWTADFPTAAQQSGGLYISKGANSTAAQQWVAVGDSRTFYFFSDDSNYAFNNYYGLHSMWFGDIKSWRSGGDAYGCMIGGGNGNNGDTKCHQSTLPFNISGMYIPRATNIIGGPVRASLWLGGTLTPGLDSGSGPTYPSPVDNGMALGRVATVREESSSFSHPYRGQMRGMAWPMAHILSVDRTSLHKTVLTGWIEDPNSYLFVAVAGQGSAGGLMFNVTSEW